MEEKEVVKLDVFKRKRVNKEETPLPDATIRELLGADYFRNRNASIQDHRTPADEEYVIGHIKTTNLYTVFVTEGEVRDEESGQLKHKYGRKVLGTDSFTNPVEAEKALEAAVIREWAKNDHHKIKGLRGKNGSGSSKGE